MDAIEIISIIQKRRDEFFDSQISGTAEDPLTHTSADVSRAIADEYDSLLEEIKRAKRLPSSRYPDLSRYRSVPHSGFGKGIEHAVDWICGLAPRDSEEPYN
jgi:hypothetical protein